MKDPTEKTFYQDGGFHQENGDLLGTCPNCADRNIESFIYSRDLVEIVGNRRIFRCIKCKLEVNEKEILPF